MTRRATLRSRFAVLRAGARQLIAMIDPSDSRLERRAYRDLIGRVELPAPTTPYHVERDVAVTMPDGAVLLTDVWLPAQGRSGAPAVLVRTPYGRFGVGATARVLAERGIFVVVQSCRGTFGSAGTFDPFTAEDRDGAAAVRWIEAQPWYPGRLATAGASYVGHTQWAITAAAPDSVALQVITVSARSFHSVFRPGGGFALGTMLAWVMALDRQEAPRPLIAWWLLTAARRRIEAAAATIPLSGAACAATGHDVGAFNRWVAGRGPGDRWWGGADSGIDVEQTPPIVLVAGWHDLFLSGQLDDHRDLVAAGRPVRLVIGAWTHMDPGPGDRALLELAGELGITDSTPPAVDVEIMPDGRVGGADPLAAAGGATAAAAGHRAAPRWRCSRRRGDSRARVLPLRPGGADPDARRPQPQSLRRRGDGADRSRTPCRRRDVHRGTVAGCAHRHRRAGRPVAVQLRRRPARPLRAALRRGRAGPLDDRDRWLRAAAASTSRNTA